VREELTQAELDAIFYGKKPKVSARFFAKEVLDPDASRAQGQRVTKAVDYVELQCIKENAFITRPARPQDIRDHRSAWDAYQKEQSHADEREVQDDQDGGGEGHCAIPFAIRSG
jgi:hypothetical protein